MGVHRIQCHVLARHACEQNRSALLCQQGEDPFHRQSDSVLPVGYQHQVDKGPKKPAHTSGKAQAP